VVRAGPASGEVAFGGEESAGASFLRRDGSVWTTDKDGIILALLASEITATTGQTPSQHYAGLTERYGAAGLRPHRCTATREQKAVLAKLSPEQVNAAELAGREDHSQADHRSGQRRADRRPQVVSESGGSPPGRPVRRTSTSSTPSRSADPSISRRSRTRRRRSSPRR